MVTGAIVLSFFSVVASLSQSASKLGKYFNASREGRVALERIETLLDSISIQTIDYRIYEKSTDLLRLENVCVSYNDQEFISNLSLNIERGKSYCLVGPSGSGKSTLISLILGTLKADSGTVKLDEALEDIGRIITVPQKLLLSPDGINGNICFPFTDINTSEVNTCLKILFEDDEILKLKACKDVEVGLSGGQEQRLLLTRLFYHNPCLSIIDEGTSALDKHNELKFYQAYQSLQKSNSKHSAIFIAHRPMALDFCDEVIHLDSGKIEFFWNN